MSKRKHKAVSLKFGMLLLFVGVSACGIITLSQDNVVDLATAQAAAQNAPWGDNVTVTIDGDTMTIQSDGIPNHERPEFYLIGRNIVPDATTARDVNFTMTLQPQVADNPSVTGGGASGIAVSGAVFFNAFEAGQEDYAIEDNHTVDGVSFIDACNGHSQPQSGVYHYHGIPFCITDTLDSEGEHSFLIGYLLDGFPIYGPQGENGETPTDLDECNGHFEATPEFEGGIYHYHTSEARTYVPICYMGEITANERGPRG